MHWAWRGRGSPVQPEHDGELGSFLFSLVEGRHRTLPRGYHQGLFAESRLFHAFFFRAMLCARAAAGGLRCVLPTDITLVAFGNPIWTRPNDLG